MHDQSEGIESILADQDPLGCLTIRFDRVTSLSLKIDMRYEAYRYCENINGMTKAIL